ncbi:MAG: glyoxalase [Ilumatobacteraceae bacterium]
MAAPDGRSGMTTVAEFVVDATADAWRVIGFDVGVDPSDAQSGGGVFQLGGIRIRLTGNDTGAGITSWVIADAPDSTITSIDGLATTHGSQSELAAPTHPNGIVDFDHVVVNTADLERTCAAIESATDASLKRIREAGSIRQGFHRLGELIVEVVTHPGIDTHQASFWGLALNVIDIDTLYEWCGDELMSAPKTAVQPGRRIASFRKDAGLGLPLAVMTPHQPRTSPAS